MDPFEPASYVEVVLIRDHPFARRADGKRGCAYCGRGKAHMDHHGHPPSLNAQGSGGNHFAYQKLKHAWEDRLRGLLDGSALPRPCGHVYAEGVACFPDQRRRDQGNYRWLLEKALGDALTAGGWIEDDDWSRYEFGNLRYRHGRGESWTLVRLFPSDQAAPLDGVGVAAGQLQVGGLALPGGAL